MPTSITSSGITFDDATTQTTSATKALGIGTAQLANDAVTAAKLAPKVTFPNYAAGVARAYNTVYQAADDGYLCVIVSGNFINGIQISVGTTSNPDTWVWHSGDDINNNTKRAGSGMIPIPKDIYYEVTPISGVAAFENITITWYPVIT
jgi:hypothetical protein